MEVCSHPGLPLRGGPLNYILNGFKQIYKFYQSVRAYVCKKYDFFFSFLDKKYMMFGYTFIHLLFIPFIKEFSSFNWTFMLFKNIKVTSFKNRFINVK